VAHWAETAPDDIALWCEVGQVTWAEWNERIADWEGALSKAGVGHGTRVGLCLPPGEQLLSLLIAIFRRGAVACPVNPQFPRAYRVGLLARLDCALVIDSDDPANVWNEIVRAGAVKPGVWSLAQPATIIFTSGSTGDPKAAVLSLCNHLESARRSNANIPLAPEDTWLLSLPMHHVAGFGVLFRCLAAGATIALPTPDVPLADSLSSLGVTHVSLVARQLAQLLDAGRIPAALKAILLGGSAIPAPLIDRAVASRLPIYTSYGMTETASQIAATPPGATRAQLVSSGRPLAADAVRIDECGRIQVNGSTRFLGYWRDDALQRPFDDAGWFSTSDMGYFDEAGYLHVTGRRDNVFMAGGENIQPEEIERALCALPGIAQAIVVPVPHLEFGATPVAFVECEGTINEDSLRDALLEVLPRFKVPHQFLPWPSELADGGMKISRAALREKAAAWGRTAADGPR
jgi:O-succinylbenzoic acid--CoA ligase